MKTDNKWTTITNYQNYKQRCQNLNLKTPQNKGKIHMGTHQKNNSTVNNIDTKESSNICYTIYSIEWLFK